MAKDRANQARPVTFSKELELSYLKDPVSYEHLDDSSNMSSDTFSTTSAEKTSVIVNKSPVCPGIVPWEKLTVQVHETVALLEWGENVEISFIIFNHTFTEGYDEHMNKLEKTTLSLLRCYKVGVPLVQSDEVHHIITAV